MVDTAKASPAKASKMTSEKDNLIALKTFIWSAKVEDKNITFLKDDIVVGFPTSEITKYVKAGFIKLQDKG